MNKSAMVTMEMGINDNGKDDFPEHLRQMILNYLQDNKELDIKDIIALTLSDDNSQKSLLYEHLEKLEDIYLDSGDFKTELERYMVEKMFPLLRMFGKDWIPEVDQLIRGFYVLDEKGQAEMLDIIQIYKKRNTDPEREEEVKKLKRWGNVNKTL